MFPGILKVATTSFLISICGRQQVAQIRGKAIYKVTDVALIPLSSQGEAEHAIASAKEHLRRHAKGPATADASSESESEDDETMSAIDSLDDNPPALEGDSGQKLFTDRRTSVAQDVIHNKGLYGRFADKWFSKKGWSAESRRNQGMSSEEDLAISKSTKNVDSTGRDKETVTTKDDKLPAPDDHVPDDVKPEEIPEALSGDKDANTISLLPKILRTTKMYFSSGNFFFSYEYDLSRGIGKQQVQTSLPLYRQSDPLVSLRPILHSHLRFS